MRDVSGMRLAMSLSSVKGPRSLALADPSLRRALEDMVRRRVPSNEVDDVVQATLTEAIASASAPEESEALRRWVFGVARHKIADHYRRSRREMPTELPELEAQSAPHSASDLLRWAEKELPAGEHAEKTLEWMLREGEGEKLESIADSEEQPAPRVRQRVTRLRQHFRTKWAAQLAAAATLVGVVTLLWWTLLRKPTEAPIARDLPADPAIAEGHELRRVALERCVAKAWDDCLKGLDDAKRLDPAGDAQDDVVAARKAAAEAQNPPPPPSATPTSSVAPPAPTTPTKLVDTKVAPAPRTSSDSTATPPAPKPAPPVKPPSKDNGSDSFSPAAKSFGKKK